MLPLLLFFYSLLHYYLLHCSTVPLLLLLNPLSSLSCILCSSVLYPCVVLVLF
ncbi:hypothetical protein PPACK8108_LOCUS16946 [Phakopsora pachyrhizi]|uniref:Uncharacterized protein n=1 Tax=Phakopsora pachyrhizi TaxID=170000 RepID=A0AAV0BA35_PHAPC|nr:hypothetical protein PPACK8108_LOCUS16946 [Phakopsora pachyrhizi]